MPKWDEKNRPVGYVLGVTPGFAKFEQGEAALTYMGLARKITKAARLGFEFAEIDFEELSEMFEPEIAKQVDMIKRVQKIEVGLHLPVAMDLCLAHSYLWHQNHEQLVYGTVAGAERMKAKFILFHTSSAARPAITSDIGRETGRSKMCAWNGMNLGDFIDKEGLRDWFMAKFIQVLFSAMGVAGDPDIISYYDDMSINKGLGFKTASDYAEKRYQEIIREATMHIANREILRHRQEVAELRKRLEDPTLSPLHKIQIEQAIAALEGDIEAIKMHGIGDYTRHWEEIKKTLRQKGLYEEFKKYNRVSQYIEHTDFNNVFNYWRIHGSEGEEHVAYHVVAKWMFLKKDKMWTSIVTDNRDPDKTIHEADTSLEKTTKLINTIKAIVTAVAGKYIEGHMTTAAKDIGVPVDKDGNFDQHAEEHKAVLEYCKDKKLHIFLETNMPGGYGEGGAPPGELRIIKATDHVNIVKAIDPENLSYCMDFEHLLTNYVDPEKEAKDLEEGQLGKYIRCLHINAPRPVKGAHGPIEPLSNDVYLIYRYIYQLRKAGVKDAYWIWEMGSHGVRESAIAFRRIQQELLKNTDPKNLPPEFFGIDKNFEAQQMIAIREHAYEPLKGMLMVPEEEHGILGTAAIERGKAAEWRREQYK
ncbi:MAG: hypothetical protein ABIG30_00765 [Candidatus Aenigmatarchaeota archaeon]